MKKLFVGILLVLMSVPVLISCNSEKDDGLLKSSNKYVRGTLTETTYESEYLGLKFVLPSGFILSTEEEMNAQMELGAEMLDMDENQLDYAMQTTVTEMSAFSPDGYPNVILMTEKLPLSNMTVEQYFDILKPQLSELGGIGYEFEMTTGIEIAGEKYDRLDARTNMYGIELNQSYIIRKLGDRLVCIVTTSTPETEDGLNDLLNAFKKY